MRRVSSGATATSRAEMVCFLLPEQRSEREYRQRHMVSVAKFMHSIGQHGESLYATKTMSWTISESARLVTQIGWRCKENAAARLSIAAP